MTYQEATDGVGISRRRCTDSTIAEWKGRSRKPPRIVGFPIGGRWCSTSGAEKDDDDEDEKDEGEEE